MSESISTTVPSNQIEHNKHASAKLASLNFEPLVIPYAQQSSAPVQTYQSRTTYLPEALQQSLRRSFPHYQQGDILQAAVIAYWGRISGMPHFDIGLAVSEVSSLAINLEGLFATYIPCRIELNLTQNFAQFLESLNPQLDNARHRQNETLELATQETILNALPGLDSQGLLPVALEIIPHRTDSQAGHGIGSVLTCTIAVNDACCCWHYNPEILALSDVERMEQQWLTLLQNLADFPTKVLSLQVLLANEEQAEILAYSQPAMAIEYQPQCIQKLWEQQVELTPGKIALQYDEEQLTYQELNHQVNQLAQYLRELGVGADQLVGLCVERSLEMIIGMLGIIKAGGAYVPLDPNYPTERLAYMVEDAQITVLLTQKQLIHQLPEHQAQLVILDQDWSKIADYDEANPPLINSVQDLAYIIYTSGSTGKPKGVMIPHSAVSIFAQTVLPVYNIQASDRILQFASINFDVAVEEIFTCLISGATLVLRTEAMIADLDTFCQTCEQWQITITNLPTAFWHSLVNELVTGTVKLPDTLKTMIIGGEKVLPEPVRAWQKYVKQAHQGLPPKLINAYGPTETTVTASTYQILTDTPIVGEIPIGRVIPHLQCYVLDQAQQLLPMGVPGELLIGGNALARGYLNRPELTAEKFIADPFSDDPGAQLYKTGDLVRYLPDGNLEYIGRIDSQVKIRGFRIELSEIETAIAQYPDVNRVAVIAREDIPGEKRLTAYVVPKNLALEVSQLRSFLQERLPNYMVPLAYVKLAELPITPGGKVDHRALPTPDFDRADLAENFVAPHTEIETKLVKIWESVLKINPIGIEDNFFELGGHSLLAVALLTQIEKTFKQSIPLGDFLAAPSIKELAVMVAQDNAAAGTSLLFPIRTTGSRPPLFLINAMGTGMLAYKLLSKYLTPEIPVYGIRAVGMDDNRLPHNRIEQMAAAYIEEMRAVAPAGPYYVAGVCTGGTISYEIACQLREQGEEVAFLGLIDSTAQPIMNEAELINGKPEAGSGTFFERFVKHNFVLRGLNNLWGVFCNPQLQLRDKLSFTSDMAHQFQAKIRHKIEAITYRQNSSNLPYHLRRARVFDAGEEALRNFTPRSYQGGMVILIRATDNPEHVNYNYQLGWDEFVKQELPVYEVPANQTTLLFEPQIHTLANHLNSCLQEIYSQA